MTQFPQDQIESVRKIIEGVSDKNFSKNRDKNNLKIQSQANVESKTFQEQDSKQLDPAIHSIQIKTNVKQIQAPKVQNKNDNDEVQKQMSREQISKIDSNAPSHQNSNSQKLAQTKYIYLEEVTPRRKSQDSKFSKPAISNQYQSQQYSIFKNSPPKIFYDLKTSAQNNVLVEFQNRIIYLPAYMRIRMKKILSLQLSELNMQLNITLVLNIFYGQLPEEIVQVLMNQTSLIFEKQQPMLLENCKNKGEGHLQTKLVNKQQQKSVKFTIRRKIDVHLDADIRWTPFQVIYPIISVQLPSINWKPQKPLKGQKDVRKWQIRFNLMDYQNNFLKFSYDNEQTFGFYRIAPNLIRSIFNNTRVNTFKDFYLYQNLLKQRAKRQKQKIQYFEKNVLKNLQQKVLKTQGQDRMTYQFDQCYANKDSQINGQIFSEAQLQIETKQKNMNNILHQLFTDQSLERKIQNYYSKSQPVSAFNMANFTIPLYKEPGSTLYTIFLPLLLLSLINLAIYFQNTDLHDRIASVSLLMLAFVSLIPTLRSQLPPSSEISMVEWMVYGQTYTTVLVLIRSLDILKEQDYTFQLQNQWFFIIASIITIQVNIIILFMMLRYSLLNRPYYKIKPLQIQINQKFSTHKLKWKNSELLQELIIKGKKFLTDQELKEKWHQFENENKMKNLKQ